MHAGRCRCTCQSISSQPCWSTGRGCWTPSWAQTLPEERLWEPCAPAYSCHCIALWPGGELALASNTPVSQSNLLCLAEHFSQAKYFLNVMFETKFGHAMANCQRSSAHMLTFCAHDVQTARFWSVSMRRPCIASFCLHPDCFRVAA